MRKLTMTSILLSLAVSTAACTTEDVDDVETARATAAAEVCRLIEHFTYSYGGSLYGWDVTTELDGSQFVDQWRFGNYGGTHVQYRVSPYWSSCSRGGSRTIQLTRPGVTLTGIHNCLPDGRQEFHGSDYQRLLTRTSHPYDFDCTP